MVTETGPESGTETNSESNSDTDPVTYFLTDQEYYGKSQRTIEAYERVLRDFEAFLADQDRGIGPSTIPEAGRRACMAWIHSLREDHAQSTVASYASYLHRFYAYMVQVGEFDRNPMAIVTDEMDETIAKDPTRRDLSVNEMRSFVRSIEHPRDQAIIVTLLKTGMRVGELCNLDRRDIALADAPVSLFPRATLENRTPALYVAAGDELDPSRRAANKRKRATVIPIDKELENVLRQWLAISPDPVAEPAPLFMSTADHWGQRVTPEDVRRLVRQQAQTIGWYDADAGAGENVTPHYFRHFFTTHLRDRTGDRGIVKYLRGDVAEDIIDTYTHNWGGRVRNRYEEHIYSLL